MEITGDIIIIEKPKKFGYYEDDETLKHLRDVELMILKDFIDICEENDIEYFSYGGTTLGAIRHQGFIPWDDDVDVIMFRDEYNKFLEIMKNKQSQKYSILNIYNYEYYPYTYSQMSLNNTEIKRTWTAQLPIDLGINIDIFILDYAPSNKIKWFFYYHHCQFLNKFAFLINIIKNDLYISNFKQKIGHTIRFIFKIFGISNSTLLKLYERFIKKSKKNKEMVYDMNAICYNKPFPVSVFRPPKKVKFESIEINVPNNVDSYLKIIYGDYMKLPPIEERHNHVPEYIDFGKY